jgi:hypothetical protein
MENVDVTAMTRVGLIFAHLLAFPAAFAAMAFGCFAIFHRHQVDTRLLARASRLTLALLVILCATGLAVIALDTRFDPAALALRPALLVKLCAVSLLMLTSAFMHGWALPLFAAPQPDPRNAATVVAALGAIGAATWSCALLLSVLNATAPMQGYTSVVAVFAAFVSLALAASLVWVRPRLADKFVFAPSATQRTSRRASSRPTAVSGARTNATVFPFTQPPTSARGPRAGSLPQGGLAPLGPQPAD